MTASDNLNMNGGEEHFFNIGAVAQMTNIPEATLRTWERRYNFPKSDRTSGGHRLYSQHDIMRLQWVKLRVKEGMQVSKAIQALQHFEQDVWQVTTAQNRLEPIDEHGDNSFTAIRTQLLHAFFSHNAQQVDQTLNDAVTRFSIEKIVYELLIPVLVDIGTAWHSGKTDVATEHFAMHLIRYYLLLWMHASPPTFNVNPVILACAPGELHEGSLLMLGLLLQRLRWPITYLGPATPLEAVAQFIEISEPSAIVFVAMTDGPAKALSRWPNYLPHVAQTGKPVVCFGGGAFQYQPELIPQIPGIFLGKTLQEGVESLNRLLHVLHPLLY